MNEVRVALYARVSKDEASKTQNPINQLEPLRRHCHEQGWQVAKEYVDHVSGADSNRPAFNKMKKDAHQHKFQLVLVWKLDRFSREGILKTFSYIKGFKQFGVGVKSLTEAWLNPDEPAYYELLLGVMSWAAAEESRNISIRTKAAYQHKKRKAEKNKEPLRWGRPWGSRDKKKRKRRRDV